MTALVVGLAYPLLLLTAGVVLAALLLAEGRRERRAAARRAEQYARPQGTTAPLITPQQATAARARYTRHLEDQ